MATTKSPEIKNVAIVGTGVIGASWAALYLARGLNVVATDPGPNAEANLRRYIDAAWKDLTALGISPNGSRDHLRFTLDMKEAVAGADLVQENGPERKDFKIKLFADMDAAAPKDSIIASSSSGLTMSVMQSACKYPERCVIGHPFNPPHMVPLVEVVAGEKTSPETVERAISFYTSIGKRAIHVRKEVVGHVGTGSKPRSIGKSCTSLDKVFWMSRIPMPRCAGDLDYVGVEWDPICCSISVAAKAGFNISWNSSRGRWRHGGKISVRSLSSVPR